MATPGVAGVDYINDRTRAEAHLREVAPEKAAFRAEHLFHHPKRARRARQPVQQHHAIGAGR